MHEAVSRAATHCGPRILAVLVVTDEPLVTRVAFLIGDLCQMRLIGRFWFWLALTCDFKATWIVQPSRLDDEFFPGP